MEGGQRTTAGFFIADAKGDDISWADLERRFISPFPNHQKWKHIDDLAETLERLAEKMPQVKNEVEKTLRAINEGFHANPEAGEWNAREAAYMKRFSLRWEDLRHRRSFDLARCIEELLEKDIIGAKDLETTSQAIHKFHSAVRHKYDAKETMQKKLKSQ